MGACDAPIRVLVVDDQPVFREAAQMVVEMATGFEVAASARSAEEAISMTAALDPDLVLMDINLPGADGFEATKAIRHRHPRTGVIVFSSHTDADNASQAVDAGAIDFIAKADFGPDTLRQLWSQHQSDWE